MAEIWVERRRRTVVSSMPADHAHPFYELYYMESGRCRLFLNHTIYHMEPGRILLIEPGALHRTIYGMTQNSERVAVFFNRASIQRMEEQCRIPLEALLSSHPMAAVEPGRRTYVENLLAKLLAEQERSDPYAEMLKQGYLAELLAFLGRMWQERTPAPIQAEEKEEAEEEVMEAARFIYEHFQEPLTLEAVAGRVHLSASYFSRRFKKLTGFGYKEYVNYVRLKEASRLLLETDLPVTEIAWKCGFSDGNYFGDFFKKEKGMSPRMYRRNPQIL